MAFKSSFTSQQIETRIKQGYYDDILQAGLDGNVFTDETKPSKQELDLQLAKSGNGQSAQITKEQVESVLTGNITTHRHDTTYNYTEFETDVWDGSSISSSLQGSGTKEDPYLIQSCADWLYLRANSGKYNVNSIEGGTENKSFAPYFKINKNLDFGNKAIPELDTEGSTGSLLMCVFDGNKAKLSNFVDSQGTGILPPSAYYFAHDFVIENFQRTADVSSLSGPNIPIFSGLDLYSAILNCTINANIAITGNISKSTQIIIITASEYPSAMGNNFATYINNYVESNGCFEGIDINITDNTTKSNDAKIVAVFSPYFMFHPISLYCAVPLDDVNIFAGEQPQEDFTIIMAIAGVQPACVYTNSDGANTVYIQADEDVQLTFTGTPKSLTEMQSESFVDELNSLLPKPAFRKDPGGGTPILAQYDEIAYDGYVKQSQFEKFKTEVSQNKEVAYTDINFFQNKNVGQPGQRFLTQDNFIEDLGGVDAVKEMTQLIADPNKIITSLAVIYVMPITITITNKIYFNTTKNDTSAPEDGDSFSFFLLCPVSNGNEPLFLETNCAVTNFNQSGMTVQVNQKQYKLVNSDNIMKIKKLTQSEYDGLSTKDGYTLYIIVG